jgi:uncharacterized cupredoxin-like copper-binding protein
MNLTRIVALSLSLSAMSVALPAFAASAAPQSIKVSLLGEAGDPMSVELDHVTAKAGAIEFDVSNDAAGTDHEVVLVKLASADQTIAVDKAKHRIDEAALETLGEVGGLKPGDKGVLKAELAPGEYVLLCNHKDHYELGMATRLTITN